MNAPTLTPAHLRALLRQDFGFFARGAFKELLPTTPILWNWHLDLIASWLQGVLAGRTRRLIINIPPRYGKSLMASVALPAFILGRDPAAEIVCASYTQPLSDKMASDTRRLMNSGWYQHIFPTRLANPRSRLSELRTPQEGTRLATSVEGTLTGRGGNIVVIDDPLNPSQAASETQRKAVNQWFDHTVTTRSNDKENGAIVIIMQRLHQDDLVGHLMARGDWDILALPAIAEDDERHEYFSLGQPRTFFRKAGEPLHPERESLVRIREAENAMGSYAFAGQYQQRPAPREGGMFKRRWFEIVEAAPAGLVECRGWDLAASVAKPGSDPDWTAGFKIGRSFDGFYYITEGLRFRDSSAAVERSLLATAQRDGKSCHIHIPKDPGQAGIAQASALTRLLSGFLIRAVPPTGSKETRAAPFAAQCEAGNVKVVKGDWNEAFFDEIEVFPFGRHDDQVDAVVDAFNELNDGGGSAGFLAMVREDNAAKNAADSARQVEAFPVPECPFAKGSLEYLKFHGFVK